MGRHLERNRLAEPVEPVLRSIIGGLIGACDLAVHRSGADDPAPSLFLHPRHNRLGGMKSTIHDDIHYRIPFVFWKFVYRRDKLDTRVVDQYVDRAQLLHAIGAHFPDFFRLGHVGITIRGLRPAQRFEFLAQRFDLARIAKTVDHHRRAFCCQRFRIAAADARC